MVRTLNAKSKSVRPPGKTERVVLLPGSGGAEPWEVWYIGAATGAKLVQSCATPLGNKLRKGTTFALPVSEVFCLPLWLNETDAKQFPGMILLQLELRGLQPRNTPAVFDWTVVAQEGTRTLVMVGVLPSNLAEEMQVHAYETFDLSARYFAFAENALTLWQEQEHWVVALTRGRDLAYFQVLTEGRITPRAIQDLICVRATLSMQGILTSLQQVVLWSEVIPEERTALQTAFQLPVNQAERPNPSLPTPPWKLIPAVVGEAKRSREIQRWQYRGFFIAVLAYLIVVAFVVTHYFMISYKVDQLNKWQAEHAEEIQVVRDTRATWNELSPVVDEDGYPLELLLHASDSIPADELHLTLFEAGSGHLRLTGEAKNAAAAFQFLDKLKADPNFAGYTWVMGQPNLLPNDLAKLQIEGTRAPTN